MILLLIVKVFYLFNLLGVYESRNYVICLFGGKNGKKISNKFYTGKYNERSVGKPLEFVEINGILFITYY